MSHIYSFGTIGIDDSTDALARRLGYGSPFENGRLKLVAWARHEATSEADVEPGAARDSGVAYRDDWRSITEDPGVDAVFVGGSYEHRADVVVSALRHGKVVLCPVPVALTIADLDRLDEACAEGKGTLLAPSRLEVLPAGRAGLQQVERVGASAVQSVYYAARRTHDTSRHGIVDDLAWEALHFLQLCVGSSLARSYVASGKLFGRRNAVDTAVMVLRFQNQVVATVELSDCLPPEFGAGETEQIEIEIISDHGMIRIEPNQHLVHVTGAAARSSDRAQWHPHPAVAMLTSLVATLDGGERLATSPPALRPVIEAMSRLSGTE